MTVNNSVSQSSSIHCHLETVLLASARNDHPLRRHDKGVGQHIHMTNFYMLSSVSQILYIFNSILLPGGHNTFTSTLVSFIYYLSHILLLWLYQMSHVSHPVSFLASSKSASSPTRLRSRWHADQSYFRSVSRMFVVLASVILLMVICNRNTLSSYQSIIGTTRHRPRKALHTPSTRNVLYSTSNVCNVQNQTHLRHCQLESLLRGNTSEFHRRLNNNHDQKPQHYLSTCTIVKLGGDMLHEFIIRNYLAGVDHFFIYDDNGNSTREDIRHVLRQFLPLITISKKPRRKDLLQMLGILRLVRKRSLFHTQHITYWHCFLTHGSKTKWLMPIDVDEFLEAKRPHELHSKSTPFEHIPFMHTFLKRIEHKAPAQIGRWNTVLTNNHVFPPHPSLGTLNERYPLLCGSKDVFDTPFDKGSIFAAKSAVQPR